MPFKFFLVPFQDAGQAEQELNAFLRSHRVLNVEKHWVEQGTASLWTFCVDFLDARSAAPTNSKPAGARPKVDYKDLLAPDEFAVFARLRDLRKELTTAEAVPVYTLFTNEQFAQMVRQRATTRAALGKIDGVGDARLDKYGGRLLEVLSEAWKPTDEASGQPV